VIPGLTTSLRGTCSPDLAAFSYGSAAQGRGPTSDISPRSTFSSWGISSTDQWRIHAPSGVSRGSRRILNRTPFTSLRLSSSALRSSASTTMLRNL
jgi:hypothetical protein